MSRTTERRSRRGPDRIGCYARAHAALRPGDGPHRRRRPERLRRSRRQPGGRAAARPSSRRSTARSPWPRAPARSWSSPRTGTPSRPRTSPRTAASGRSIASPTRGAPSSTPTSTLPDGAPRVRKGANGEDGYSGFTMRDATTGEEIPTELDGLLRDRGIERVVVVGLATDYCVKATALDAVRLGYETHVLTDAIAAVDLEPGDGERALEEMAAAGVGLSADRGCAERAASTSSTRPTSCSGPTTRRAPTSSAGTASSCPVSRACATSCSTSCARRAPRTSAAPRTA